MLDMMLFQRAASVQSSFASLLPGARIQDLDVAPTVFSAAGFRGYIVRPRFDGGYATRSQKFVERASVSPLAFPLRIVGEAAQLIGSSRQLFFPDSLVL